MNRIHPVRESVRTRQKRLAFPSNESMCVDVREPRNAVRKCPRPDDRSDPGLVSVRGWMARPRYVAKGQSHVHQTYR